MKLSNGTEVITKLLGKPYGKYIAYHFCAVGISWAGDWEKAGRFSNEGFRSRGHTQSGIGGGGCIWK